MGSTVDDFAADARAAVAFLRSRPEVKGSAVGIVGHSEGGLIAPMVAVADKSVGFLVLLAPPGEPLRSLLMRQTRDLYRLQGLDEKLIDRALAAQAEDLDLIADPAVYLRSVKIPVLALFGEKDLQVESQVNAEAVRASLAAAGNPDHEVRSLPGLNHLFQHAKTGGIEEYAEIEETFAPEALSTIGDWIVARFSNRAR